MSVVYWHNKSGREEQEIVKDAAETKQELMVKVGQLIIENDWLKKICTSARSQLGE